MTNNAYITHVLEKVESLYAGLLSKKTHLSAEAYKALLNDYYLKHFGFDRRTGKMMTEDYITKTYCRHDPFPMDKCLLLACFLMEDVALSQDRAEQNKLLAKVMFIDRTIAGHFPGLILEPLKKELETWTARLQEYH